MHRELVSTTARISAAVARYSPGVQQKLAAGYVGHCRGRHLGADSAELGMTWQAPVAGRVYSGPMSYSVDGKQ